MTFNEGVWQRRFAIVVQEFSMVCGWQSSLHLKLLHKD